MQDTNKDQQNKNLQIKDCSSEARRNLVGFFGLPITDDKQTTHDMDISNLSFSDEEIKRIADVLAILIKVDQRIKGTKREVNINEGNIKA